MRKNKKLLAALFCMLVLTITNLAIAPATVQAAGKLKFAKSITLMKGQEVGYGIMNFAKTDKVVKVKSSNKKVVSVKSEKSPEGYDYTINMKAKKAGTSTITLTVKRKSGKRYTFKTKVRVYNYANPLKKCTFGETDYTKRFDKNYSTNVPLKTAKTEKINAVAKKGYKIIGIYYGTYGDGTQKKIKNGSTITLDDMHYVRIDYKNTAKKYTQELYIMGEQVEEQ